MGEKWLMLWVWCGGMALLAIGAYELGGMPFVACAWGVAFCLASGMAIGRRG